MPASILLNAVTANVTGPVIDLEAEERTIAAPLFGQFRNTLVVRVTGAPTAGTVQLQVSHDGTNFVNIGTAMPVATAFAFQNIDGVFSHARAVLAGLTGGAAPTITATLMTGT